MDRSVWFRWLGVAGIELRIGSQVLLVDPYLTRIPFHKMWLGRVRPDRRAIAQHVRRADFVLVTHAHFDHLMDVPDVVRNTGATVLGSANTCRLAGVCGVPEDQMREIGVGQELALGQFRVRVLPARHMRTPGFLPGGLGPGLRPPLRARDYRMDDCFCFLIAAGGCRLLTDPGQKPEGPPRADLLLVGPYRDAGYYASLLDLVCPRMVIPLHWDDHHRPLTGPLRPYLKPPQWAFPPLQRVSLGAFREVVARYAPGTKVFVPEVLRPYDLS